MAISDQAISRIKLIGVAVGFIGITSALAEMLGCYVDQERVVLAELVWSGQGGIVRDTPGFDAFLEAFPPPHGVDPAQVTHIVKNVLQFENGPSFAGALRYLADGRRSNAVATFAEVREWANQTYAGWYSWTGAALGWLLVAVGEGAKWWRSRSDR